MSFAVEPDDLKDFARGLDTLAAAASRAQDYSSYAQPKGSGGALLQRWVSLVEPVHPAVSELFAHLHAISARGADEIVATARNYETTDTKVAARADRKVADVTSVHDGAIDRTGAGKGPMPAAGPAQDPPFGGVGPIGTDHE